MQRLQLLRYRMWVFFCSMLKLFLLYSVGKISDYCSLKQPWHFFCCGFWGWMCTATMSLDVSKSGSTRNLEIFHTRWALSICVYNLIYSTKLINSVLAGQNLSEIYLKMLFCVKFDIRKILVKTAAIFLLIIGNWNHHFNRWKSDNVFHILILLRVRHLI